MITLDNRVLFVKQNGLFSTMILFKSAMLKNESEDEFIHREIERKLLNNPELRNCFVLIKHKSELREAVNKTNKKSRHYLRCNKDGVIFVDESIKTSADIYRDKENIVIQKLKSYFNLDDVDIGVILRKSN